MTKTASLPTPQSRSQRTSVAFLVNGDFESPAAFRARAFASELAAEFEIQLEYRIANKVGAIFRFVRCLRRTRPAVTYVFDMAYSGVIAGFWHRLIHRNRVIIETGDAIYALARSGGTRGTVALWLTWFLETCSLRFSDGIVVRGTLHQRQLASRGIKASVIQDGVENDLFRPMEVNVLRKALGLDGVFTVGLVGSLTWSPRLQTCYGSELVEAISLLRDLPVKGIVIGDGTGLDILKAHVHQQGIEDRIVFLGRIPYRELSQYLNLIDICLSTQTNDVVGQVRTTGKLPLYLACGKYVLASRVGEASLLLSDDMLVAYEGTKDPAYPQRIAQRIRSIGDTLPRPATTGESGLGRATL